MCAVILQDRKLRRQPKSIAKTAGRMIGRHLQSEGPSGAAAHSVMRRLEHFKSAVSIFPAHGDRIVANLVEGDSGNVLRNLRLPLKSVRTAR